MNQVKAFMTQQLVQVGGVSVQVWHIVAVIAAVYFLKRK